MIASTGQHRRGNHEAAARGIVTGESMFWIGLLVALVAGLLSIGYARRKIATRFPRLNETRLDILLVVALIIGLFASAQEHLQSEKQLESLRNNIVSGAATVDLILDWPIPKGDARSTMTSWSAYLGGVGYVAFAHRTSPLLVIRNRGVVMKSISDQRVSLISFCDLNTPESLVHSSLHDLIKADLLQVGLPETVPDSTRVESGSVKVTLNGSREVVIPIQGVVIHDAKIILELHGLSLQ